MSVQYCTIESNNNVEKNLPVSRRMFFSSDHHRNSRSERTQGQTTDGTQAHSGLNISSMELHAFICTCYINRSNACPLLHLLRTVINFHKTLSILSQGPCQMIMKNAIKAKHLTVIAGMQPQTPCDNMPRNQKGVFISLFLQSRTQQSA